MGTLRFDGVGRREAGRRQRDRQEGTRFRRDAAAPPMTSSQHAQTYCCTCCAQESANGKGVLPGETAQTRCSPDIVSYSLIMDACAQRGNMHHVERWFRQMLNSGRACLFDLGRS